MQQEKKLFYDQIKEEDNFNIIEDSKIDEIEWIQNKTQRQNNIYGNYKAYYIQQNLQPLIAIGPHWLFSVGLLTFMLIFATCLLVYLSINSGFFQFILVLFLSFLEISVFLMLVILNPGMAIAEEFLTNIDNNQPNLNLKCKICLTPNNLENLNTYHCSFCNICIQDHDHHCIWTGKCIGKKNLTLFYVFLVVTFIYLLTYMIIIQQI